MFNWDPFTIKVALKLYLESRFPPNLMVDLAVKHIKLINSRSGEVLDSMRERNASAVNFVLLTRIDDCHAEWKEVVTGASDEELLMVYDRFATVISFFDRQPGEAAYRFRTDLGEVLLLLLVDLWRGIQAGLDDAEVLAMLPQPKMRKK